MDENHKDSSSKTDLVKDKENIIYNLKMKKSPFSFIKKLLNIFSFFVNIFISLRKKINSCSSKCSILIQFPINLIPISIIMILIIFFIHIYFYSYLYVYNFSKVFKEEFLDLYITKIGDLNSELTSIIVKETKIDIENQLFFQIYFKELSLAGILKRNKKYFSKFSNNPGSTTIYSRLNNYKNTDADFNLREDLAKTEIDDNDNNNLAKFIKIYYYLFPHIWYGSLETNMPINQSYFMSYEINYEYDFDSETYSLVYFRIISFTNRFSILCPVLKNEISTNNFRPFDSLISPMLMSIRTEQTHFIDDNFYDYNWFVDVDYDFTTEAEIGDQTLNVVLPLE